MFRLRHGSKCLLWWFLLGALPLHAASGPATPAPELDALFQRTNGWIGADADYSIPLDSRTALWLFGDSIVASCATAKGATPK